MNIFRKFVTLEGPDGSGKTTQGSHVKKWLEDKGEKVILTREPGGSNIAEDLRAILLNIENEISSLTELGLVMTARRDHLDSKIIPALKDGYWVISDRYIDSTYVYQGYGRGLDIETIDTITECFGIDYPKYTFYFNLSIENSLARKSIRNKIDPTKNDRMEKVDYEFFNRVHQGFQKRLMQNRERFININANQSLDDVTSDMFRELERIYNFSQLYDELEGKV